MDGRLPLILLSLFSTTVANVQQDANSDIDSTQQSYFFYQQSEYPRDCSEVTGHCPSPILGGVFSIRPEGYADAFDVYCDNAGSTVVGRRVHGVINFTREWEDYASGFGFPSHEFWLGNRKLSFLTNQKKYKLVIDVTLKDGTTFNVTYNDFRISDEGSDFQVLSMGQQQTSVTTCPTNMVPGNCSCQRSCAEPDTCSILNCHPTGECVCPEGYLLDGGYCMQQNQCGCFIPEADDGQGILLKEGDVHISPNCERRCSCSSGQLHCKNDFQCSSHGACQESNDQWSCSCNEGYEGDGVDCTSTVTAVDCQDVFNDGQRDSGQYYIKPDWSPDRFLVYCNMADGGGWTVIQRQDGSDNFHRNWTEYREGFGSVEHGMWLGNDRIYRLTNQKAYRLRIDLTDRDGRGYYATYNDFRINDESNKYRLASVGSYGGTTGRDKLTWNVGKQFSTYDQDNDGWGAFHCAEEHQGGWWFGSVYTAPPQDYSLCRNHDGYCEHFPTRGGCAGCTRSFLNGDYHSTNRGQNIFWERLGGYDCSIQYTEMRIQPV